MSRPNRIYLLASYLVSALLAYALGFRGFGLLLPAALIWIGVFFAMALVDLVLVAPRVKPLQADYVELDLFHRANSNKADATPPKTRKGA